MSEAKRDLAHEFPEYKERIQELKASSRHFVKLSEEYHALVKELHQIEVESETPSDEYVETLKKKRLRAKDKIAAMLQS